MNWRPDSFQNGALWPLFILVLVPLLFYLLDRRRARTVEWPAMRFFLSRSQSRLRWIRLREALLIVSRSAAVAAFVFAVLRPRSTEEVVVAGDRALPVGVVLVLDTSYSMARRDDPAAPSNLEIAKEAALEVVDGLRPGDLVQVIAGGGSLGQGGVLSLEAARREIQRTSFAAGSFHLVEALDRALSLAAGLPAAAREIYIITDLQAGSSRGEDDGRWRFLASRLAATTPRPRLVIVECGSEPPNNLWIAALEREELLAVAAQPLRFVARVDSMRPPERSVRVRWLVDDRWIDEEEIETGGDAVTYLDHTFAGGGVKRVCVELGPDGLEEDNRRCTVVEVHERAEVLVVGEDEPAGTSAARYVELALLPRVPGAPTPNVVFRPRRVDRLPAGSLEAYRAVILVDVRAPGRRETERLESYVRAGGGVIVFCGSRLDADHYNETLYRNGRGPLPAQLAGRRTATPLPLHPTDADTRHPVLSLFRDPGEGDPGRLEIYAYRETGTLHPSTSILARVGGTSPWILERPFGDGRLLLVTSAPRLEDSNLAETPLFLPLLHRLVLYAARGRSAGTDVVVGTPLEVDLGPHGGDASLVSLQLPDGRIVALETTRAAGRSVARYDDTLLPGEYRFEIRPPAGNPVTVLRTVHIDPAESDLRRLPPGRFNDLAATLGLERVARLDDLPAATITEQVDAEFWPLAMGIALLFLAIELALQRAAGRRTADRKPPRAAGRRFVEGPVR